MKFLQRHLLLALSLVAVLIFLLVLNSAKPSPVSPSYEEEEDDGEWWRHKMKQPQESLTADSSEERTDGPNFDFKKYEQMRRRAGRDVDELWRYTKATLTDVLEDKALSTASRKKLKRMLKDSEDRHNAIFYDLDKMAEFDGLHSRREEELLSLGKTVQTRLEALQNPEDCAQAGVLLCHLDKACGFGCQLHHAAYCLGVAYATGRTMKMDDGGWKYGKYEDLFLPVTPDCPNLTEGKPVVKWPARNAARKLDDGRPFVLELGIIDSIKPRPEFLPPAVPDDIADRLEIVHGNPGLWWVGQLMSFLMRPNDKLKGALEERGIDLSREFNDGALLVGVHIRRTDKISAGEASYHSASEYMNLVDEVFRRRSYHLHNSASSEHKVYLATDDPAAIKECKAHQPSNSTYSFLGGGDSAAAEAGKLKTRYSTAGAVGVATDILALSHTDHLVCTLSSQVCRCAYELMQTRAGKQDASGSYHSLDDMWYFGGGGGRFQRAIYPHAAESGDEIELRVGDGVRVAGNHWNGFNKGTNLRTKKTGLYPEYKTVSVVPTCETPVGYDEGGRPAIGRDGDDSFS